MESLKIKEDEMIRVNSKTKFDSEELRSFERKSFENMIYFYRDELIQVMKGVRATELFSTYTRRRFLRIGITRVRGGKTILTEQAKRSLEEIVIKHDAHAERKVRLLE